MREELLQAIEAARGHLRSEDLETINAEMKKLTDVVYKFSAAVQQSAGAQQQTNQQQQQQTTTDGQENNKQN